MLKRILGVKSPLINSTSCFRDRSYSYEIQLKKPALTRDELLLRVGRMLLIRQNKTTYKSLKKCETFVNVLHFNGVFMVALTFDD
jgi:hypothetical protein